MQVETISKQVIEHYLANVTLFWFDEHDLPPDDIVEYEPYILSIKPHLKSHGDENVFRTGLENLLLSASDDVLESLNAGLYPFDGEEMREIIAYSYAILFPDSKLPKTAPDVVWNDMSWLDWLDRKDSPLPHLAKVDEPIHDLYITKAQFAILLERVVGEPFVLDDAALHDLGLREEDIIDAEVALIVGGHLLYEDGVSSELALLFQTMYELGWKFVMQTQAQDAEWVQISIHVGENIIVGEALNIREDRLLKQFNNIHATVNWLIDLTLQIPDKQEQLSPQPLEKLLPQANAMFTFLITNLDDVGDEAKATIIWLQAGDNLWLVNSDVEQRDAINITKPLLHNYISEVIKRYMPALPRSLSED